MPHARHWIAIATIALSGPVYAAGTAAKTPSGPWSGSAELGGVATTGNTRTSSIDGKLKLEYTTGPWTSTARLEALHASSDGTTNANRIFGNIGTHYALDASDYLFGDLRGTHDTFSGYRYQASTSVGIGRQFVKNDTIDLRAEIGPGYRQSEIDDGPIERNAVVRAQGVFSYHFTPHAHFDQTLTAISGSDNTELESVSSLTTNISGALALKVSYTVLHNTQAPLGRKKTDTYTAINLVYGF